MYLYIQDEKKISTDVINVEEKSVGNELETIITMKIKGGYKEHINQEIVIPILVMNAK